MHSYLSHTQDAALASVTETIRELTAAHKIYLLGTAVGCRVTESIFRESPGYCQQVAAYDLLALLPGTGNKNAKFTQDRVEQRCRVYAPVSLLMIRADRFRNWLALRHPFTGQVVQKAPLLYDDGSICFNLPPSVPPDPAISGTHNWQAATNAFLSAARLHHGQDQPALACFNLHQAVEQALTGLLQTVTGYRFTTHSLERLFAFSQTIYPELHFIFPRHTAQEERLFWLLKKAYRDPRYADDFTISPSLYPLLAAKVERLAEMVQEKAGLLAN